jgi:hypothetical protein
MIGSGSDNNERAPAADECTATAIVVCNGVQRWWLLCGEVQVKSGRVVGTRQPSERKGSRMCGVVLPLSDGDLCTCSSVSFRSNNSQQVENTLASLEYTPHSQDTMISAVASRSVVRSAPRATRRFASEVQQNAFIQERLAIEHHAAGTVLLG